MKKYIGIFILLLGGIGQLQAQKSDSLRIYPILKIIPTTLIDFDNSFTMGFELPIKGSPVAFQVEMGYGKGAWNVWQNQRNTFPNQETWRARMQVRYYFMQKNYRGPYVAVDYFYKQNNLRRWESIGQQCTNGQCAFFEQRSVALGRFVNALNLKFGWQLPASRKVVVDVFAGIGIRDLNIRYIDGTVNENILDNRNTILLFRNNRIGSYGPYPSVSLGFSVGYLL